MKQYIKPNTELISIKTQYLLHVSNTNLDGVSVSKDAYVGGTSDSRRGSLWDDDEDDY